METKTCSRCGEEKQLECFRKRKDTGTHRNECIDCKRQRDNEYYLRNKEERNRKSREYYHDNKDKVREYRKKNKDKILIGTTGITWHSHCFIHQS